MYIEAASMSKCEVDYARALDGELRCFRDF
jgi:hypothetical protein